MAVDTKFAPAERVSPDEIVRQHEKLAELAFVQDFLDAMPNMSVVLNAERQIVFANRVFVEFVGAAGSDELLGKKQCDAFHCIYGDYLGMRPGEAVSCVRARLEEGGCGTTTFCKNCGAVISILNSQRLKTLDIQECRMLCGGEEDDVEALDLRVWSRPIEIDKEVFTVFSLMDISDEKRRKVLERIFYHDVLNTAGGVKGLADLLVQTGLSDLEIRDIASMLSESADHLIDEIHAQRMLADAERGDLQVSVSDVFSLEIVCRIIRQFHSSTLGKSRALTVAASAEHFDFRSDPVLLRRTLINMVKNALEAEPEGGTVTMNCFMDGDEACFSVHESIVMPPDVQLQMFTRSFSTKGGGRGLGTYSIKLITEKYLQGRVSFVSDEEHGTVFTVRYPLEIQSTGDLYDEVR